MPAEFVNRLSELANAEQAPHLSSGLLIASELAPLQTALTIRALRCEGQRRVFRGAAKRRRYSVADERRHRQKDLPFCLSVCAPGLLLAMPWRAEDMGSKGDGKLSRT